MRRLPVSRLLALSLTLCTGCGSTLWLITPRPDVSYQEITRTTQVRVTSSQPGATVYVDGAEAGPAPRSISVAHRELRRQRRQDIWPALIGTALDVLAFGVLAVAAGNEAPEALTIILPVGLGVTLLDIYLITGRSIVNEGVDTIPAAIDVGVMAPGFTGATRKIRVPDITALKFDLVPDPNVVQRQVPVDGSGVVDENQRPKLPAVGTDVPANVPQHVAPK